MANRFERLFQLPANQYVEGSPVILAAGALLKDNETGSIIAQLKFKSISPKRIKAVKVSLAVYDIAGVKIQGVDDYQYLEINISESQEFGGNKAIIMPMPISRSFEISSIVVVFHDGTMWESTDSFEPLPARTRLLFGKAELEKQYRIETNESAQYAPKEAKGIWQCACGTWNGSHNCSCCRILKQTVFSADDVATLTKRLNIRLAAEAEQRRIVAEKEAEQKKIAAQKQAEQEMAKKETRKRNLKIAVLVLVVFCSISMFVVALNEVIIPTKKYNDASALLANGQYQDAIIAFSELGDFKDSSERVVEAKMAIVDNDYTQALELLKNGQYQSAIGAFEALGNYKDSAQKIIEAQEAIKSLNYSEALTLIQNDNWKSAIEIFGNLGDYKDSKTMLTEATYQLALQHLSQRKDADALELFVSIRRYKDVEAYIANFEFVISTEKYTYANGKTSVSYYSETGLLTKIEDYSYTYRDGKPFALDPYIILCTYDSQDRLSTEQIVDLDGIIEATTCYTYDAQGNLIRKETTEKDGTVYLREYHYNGQDQLILEVYYGSSNERTCTAYTYDSNGNLVGEYEGKCYLSVDTIYLQKYSEYQYDSAANCISNISYNLSSAGSVDIESFLKNPRIDRTLLGTCQEASRYTYLYDKENNLVRETWKSSSSFSEIEYVYADGRLVSKIVDSSLFHNETRSYFYDDFGNLIKENSTIGTPTVYTYYAVFTGKRP